MLQSFRCSDTSMRVKIKASLQKLICSVFNRPTTFTTGTVTFTAVDMHGPKNVRLLTSFNSEFFVSFNRYTTIWILFLTYLTASMPQIWNHGCFCLRAWRRSRSSFTALCRSWLVRVCSTTLFHTAFHGWLFASATAQSCAKYFKVSTWTFGATMKILACKECW